jgi:RND family efflux transporter MFP subunit
MRVKIPTLAALALLAGAGCQRGPREPAGTAPEQAVSAPVKVQTTRVGEQPMPEYLTVTGSLRAHQQSDIAADANGKILQTLIERGQRVKRGQVLVTLDARSATLGAQAASAQAKVAQSQLEQAQRECGRVQHLLETGAISQADFDRQTATCTANQWSATAAEAQQASATKLLGDTRIRAPFDGVVGERMVDVGQYVEPSTRIASIYEADPLRLQLTIPEANISALHEGMPVTFAVAAFGDEKFTGAVKYISPNVRESTRDLVVEAMVPNADGRLRPGMFAVAKIELAERAEPAVDSKAVVRDETEARIFVVGADKQIQERLVQLGETKQDLVAVLSGVRPGESVVLQPGPNVRDGARAE